MSVLAIEFNDAAITGVDQSATLFSAPGYAFLNGSRVLFGQKALGATSVQAPHFFDRYWYELSDEPLPGNNTSGYQTAADLACAQLQYLWALCAPAPDEVIFVVPSHWSQSQLGLLLGFATEIGIPVAGLVDSSVAATRHVYEDRRLVHIDAGLHAIGFAQLSQGEDYVGVATSELTTGTGIVALRRAAADFIAQSFVASSRFDPLHDAKSEQQLFTRLEEWLAHLLANEALSAELEFSGNVFKSRLSAAELARHLGYFCEPMVQRLRAMLGGVPGAIQVTHILANFPGVLEALSSVAEAEVFVLDPGAAGRGAIARSQHLSNGGAGFRLIKKLPWDQEALAFAKSDASATDTDSAPSHILYQSKVYRLSDRAFSIGTELPAGEHGLVTASSQGISRRHCTLQLSENRVTVNDHSRFGTFLNGHRVDESAVLQAGDVLTVGAPPEEFRLLVEVAQEG
ncbi:MAG: FHA domain-containing protein [Gammaproteobacteria bacterium]